MTSLSRQFDPNMIDDDADVGSSTVIGLAEKLSADAAFSSDMRAICKRVGMSQAFYGFVSALRIQLPGCSTYPSDWRAAYYQEGYHTLDPLISVLNGSRRPTYLDELVEIPAYRKIWIEHASEFGIAPPQIGVPMFGPHGETAIFIFHSAEVPKFEFERNKLIRKAVMRAVEFHEGVMDQYNIRDIMRLPNLTEREKYCLFQAAQGKQTAAIAEEGSISHRTVETHLKACRDKLEAKTTVHAVARAVYMGLIQPG